MARARVTPRHRVLTFYLLVPGLLALDWALFRYLLGTDYLAWYLSNGALVAVGAAFVSRVWDAVEDLGRPLVSADPVAYYSACLQAVGVALFVAGTAVVPPAPGDRGPGGERFRLDAVVRPLDALVNLLVAVVVVSLVLGWVLFVAPANYLVTLLAGAPAREHLRHPGKRVIGVVGRRLAGRTERATVRTGPDRTLYVYETGTRRSPALTAEEREALAGDRPEIGGITDLTFGRNPFATTQTLAGLVVFAVGRLV
jgi:hypothetical protein